MQLSLQQATRHRGYGTSSTIIPSPAWGTAAFPCRGVAVTVVPTAASHLAALSKPASRTHCKGGNTIHASCCYSNSVGLTCYTHLFPRGFWNTRTGICCNCLLPKPCLPKPRGSLLGQQGIRSAFSLASAGLIGWTIKKIKLLTRGHLSFLLKVVTTLQSSSLSRSMGPRN